METVFAAAHGRRDDALRGLEELESVTGINASGLQMLADAALFLGEPERAIGFVNRQLLMDLTPTLIRLDPSLHPLLDRPPFAPRRCDKTLVWPLEAPMMDARVHGLFREVKIDSGLPKATEVSQA